MLSNANLIPRFWAKSMATTTHLINRSPSRVLDKEQVAKMVWFGTQPLYKHLRVFGYKACSHIPKESRTKFEPKRKKCIFVGYGDLGKMGYRLWDLESRKVIRSNDVYFNEAKFYAKPKKVEEIKRFIFSGRWTYHSSLS